MELEKFIKIQIATIVTGIIVLVALVVGTDIASRDDWSILIVIASIALIVIIIPFLILATNNLRDSLQEICIYDMVRIGNKATVLKKDKQKNESTIHIGFIHKIKIDSSLLNKLVYDNVLEIRNYRLPDNYNPKDNDKEEKRITDLIHKLKILSNLTEINAYGNNGYNPLYLYSSGNTTAIIIPYSVSYIDISSYEWTKLAEKYNFKENIKIIGGKGLISLRNVIPSSVRINNLDVSELDTRNIYFWSFAFKTLYVKNIKGLDKLNTCNMKTAQKMFFEVNCPELDLRGLNIPRKVSLKNMIYDCVCNKLITFRNVEKHRGAKKVAEMKNNHIEKIVNYYSIK